MGRSSTVIGIETVVASDASVACSGLDLLEDGSSTTVLIVDIASCAGGVVVNVVSDVPVVCLRLDWSEDGSSVVVLSVEAASAGVDFDLDVPGVCSASSLSEDGSGVAVLVVSTAADCGSSREVGVVSLESSCT